MASDIASTWVLLTTPMMARALSCSTAFWSAARAPGLVDWLSSVTSLICLPFTPPAALICFSASLIALICKAPSAAEAPVTGGVQPMMISPPAAGLAAGWAAAVVGWPAAGAAGAVVAPAAGLAGAVVAAGAVPLLQAVAATTSDENRNTETTRLRLAIVSS